MGHPTATGRHKIQPPHECFHLVLVVTHSCNLRCRYCYTGRKFDRRMPLALGRTAIDRAVRSIRPGGKLELGFFGGEPMLVPALVEQLLDYALQRCRAEGIALHAGLSTNGTVRNQAAWHLLMRPELDVCLSHDGLPEVHNRHRRTPEGRPTAHRVLETIELLQAAGRPVRCVMVVRPDTAEYLPEGIAFLRRRGVKQVDLALDVWARWQRADAIRLERAIERAADLWRAGLPECAINWFDEKAAQLLQLPLECSARCGFGNGEIAVAPSGRLFPCERLVGEDAEHNPMRLPGHVLDGNPDFNAIDSPCGPLHPDCDGCAAQRRCSAYCRCANYVRTGDPQRPDALLCLVSRVCERETIRVLQSPAGSPRRPASGKPGARVCESHSFLGPSVTGSSATKE